MGRLYRCLRAVVRAVTPRMTTTWEEPFSGNPSVFVCNHVGAFGPIDMVVKFPLRDEVRVWMLHSPGGAARWVEAQLSAYERQHPGVLIYLRQVSADELTAEETSLPDVVL